MKNKLILIMFLFLPLFFTGCKEDGIAKGIAKVNKPEQTEKVPDNTNTLLIFGASMFVLFMTVYMIESCNKRYAIVKK